MQEYLQQRFLKLLERLKNYTKELKESVQAKDARLQEVGYKNY